MNGCFDLLVYASMWPDTRLDLNEKNGKTTYHMLLELVKVTSDIWINQGDWICFWDNYMVLELVACLILLNAFADWKLISQ
jgi:hypothetical protein